MTRPVCYRTRVTTNYRAILFDLDGTLADTLADLANATNWALTQLGCPTHPVDRYRFMVGDGAPQLCARALPPDRQDLLDEALQLMRTRYAAHSFEQTRLYDGIPELVDALAARGYRLAVLSNKPDDFTKQMIQRYFCSRATSPPRKGSAAAKTLTNAIGPFDVVRGQLPNVPLKPDPSAALQIARELAVAPPEWLYLGDTNTDMRTATAAGMTPVGALWGFRDRDELLASGARHLVAKPEEVLKLL
jgi:phosphoglycolate phosphatase